MQEFISFATHNWMLFLVLIFIATMIIGDEVSRRTRGYHDVGPDEATRILNRDEALLLDVREENEYRADGHILNALHIPVGELQRRLGELEKHKGRPVIAYCRSGHRSRTACSQLKKGGFEQVYNLGGGIMAWQSANLPVTKKK